MPETRATIVAWAAGQSRDFNQLCQAWTWQICKRFGTAPAVYASAYAAYRASKIVSKDPAKAPDGAIHYWALSKYGHVAPGFRHGETLMATSHTGRGVEVVNGRAHLVLVDVDTYNRAAYLGWSYTNGRNSFSVAAATVVKPLIVGPGLAKTSTALTGSPGTMPSNAWKRIQLLAHAGTYTGPIDGRLEKRSWAGVQAHLRDLGFYRGDIDGDPKKLTYAALQRWAGVKNPTITNTWRNIAPANWRAIGRKLNTL